LNQDKKIKTLFISSWYPNRVKPTLGNFVQKHAEAASLFADVTVLHVCFDKCESKFEIVQELQGKINTIIIYINRPQIFFRKFFLYLKAYRIGLDLIIEKSGKPDIVHANVLFPVGLVFLFLRAFKKLPFVFSEHWTGYLLEDPSKINFFRKYFTRKIAGKASCIMPVSENLKNAMLKFGFKGNYKVIPNVVDTSVFIAKNNIASPKKNILHVSSFDDEQKNISGIIKVIKKLSEKRQDFTMNFISDGDQKPFIKQAEDLSLLDKFVFFHGEKSTQAVAEMMMQSDFLLLFSNYENLPCVIVEAFASGLPVVSTDVGGIPEHLTEKHGILVKPKDDNSLYEAIDKMLDNYTTYDKNYLHEYAVNNFSYESVGKNFLDIYSETINR